MFLLFSPIGIIFAKDTGGNPGARLKNPLRDNIDSLPKFLDLILKAVVTIATPIIVLMIVYSGFLFVKAQGNPDKLSDAKKAIMWTIIGAVVILGASVLSAAIGGTVDDLQRDSANTTVRGTVDTPENVFYRTTTGDYGDPADFKSLYR